MKTIKEHVNEMFKKIPNSDEKEQIKQEIIENLEEKVFDLIAAGKAEEDAINKAIVEFGDIEELELELGNEQPDRKRKTRLDLEFSVWASALIIALVVFINLYYSPDSIWFIYPTFGVLWLPLYMYYRWMRVK